MGNLTRRISELNAEKRKAESELEILNKRKIEIPNFEVKSISHIKPLEIKPFTPTKKRQVLTMKDLMQKRKEEEAERRRLLQQQIAKNFDAVREFIEMEDPDRAEDLLSTSSRLQELKDNKLRNLYEELLNDILFDIVEEETSLLYYGNRVTKRSFSPKGNMMYVSDIGNISKAISYLLKLGKDNVIDEFHLWEREVRKAASESEEFKALKDKSLNDYNYNCAVYDIFRKYLLINLPGRCIKSEPPVQEPQEPEYITVDYGQCPF